MSELLNPWRMVVRRKDEYSVTIELINQLTGEIKLLSLDVDEVNDLIEKKENENTD